MPKKSNPSAAVKNDFEYILDNIPGGTILIDPESGKISMSNPYMRRMLGCTKSDLSNKRVISIHPADPHFNIEELYSRLLKNTDEPAKDVPVKRKDGTVFYTDITASVIEHNGKTRLMAVYKDITERREAENRLKENEELLKTILDTTADGILLVDNDGKVSHFNSRFIDMWNIDPEIAASMDDKKIINSILDQLEDPPGFLKKVNKLYSSGRRLFDEVRFIDGRIFERYTSPLVIDGQVHGRIWDFRDITGRITAQDDLKKSEEKFRNLFMSMNEGFYLSEVIYDADGKPCDYRYIEVNQKFEEIIGLSRDRIIGRRYREIVPVNTSDWLETYFKTAATGIPANYNFYSNEYDKHFTTYSYRLSHDQIAVFVVDNTETVRALKELAETRSLLDTAIKQTPIPMIMVSAPDNVVRIANIASREYLGVQDEPDISGKPMSEVNHSWQDYDENGVPVPPSELPLDQALRGIAIKNKECYTKRKDGTIRWNSVSAIPVRNSEGEIIAAYVVFPDITERKHAEELLVRNESMLQSILQAAPVGVGLLKDRIFIKVNPTLCRITGYSEEELLGKSTRVIYPDDSEFKRIGNELYNKMLKDGVGTSEATIRKKDGSVLYGILSLSPFDPENTSAGVTATLLDITERKHAEEELNNSRKFLMSIIDQSPVSTGILDDKGTLIKTNSACRRLLRITDNEIIGKYNILEDNIIIEQNYMPLIKNVFEKGETSNFELEYDSSRLQQVQVNKPVSVILDVTVFPIRDTEGKISNAIIQHNDITKRRKAEAELRKTASELRLIFKNMLNAFIIWESVFDENGKYVSFRFRFFNDAYSRISGLRQEDVIGKDVFKVWPDTEQSWVEAYGKVATTGIPMTFDMYHKPTNGWYHCNAYRPTESTSQVCVIFEDVTERKKSEEALKNSEAVLKSLFNATPVGISLLDKRRFRKVNDSLCRMLGYSEEELLGKDSRILYAEENEYNRVAAELLSQLVKKKSAYTETQYKRKDNTKIDVLTYISPFDSTDMSDGGVALAVLDITEAKRLGMEKMHLEEMLARAQKMEAIGTMAGGIAHDFNNILGGIFGYSELCLIMEGNPPDTVNYVREIIKAAERAKDLITRILTFSRQSEHELKPIIPKYIIKEVTKLLRASTPAEVELKVTAESESVILAEPTLIHQVIMNLCTNAIHAMRSKPGTISVKLEDMEADGEFTRLHPGLKPGKHVMISVSDTGTGIDPGIINNIFDPFFTTKPQGEGTGLGLSVVHGIVKKIGGAINVYSEPGRGATFNIFIPVIKDKAAETDRSASIIEGGSERILLVDDEESIANSIKSILVSLGYRVKAFTDCREALKEFRDNPGEYDVIVTDYSMPFMTGLEFVSKLKNARKDIPIVLNSGYINTYLEESASAEGVDVLLAKPVSTYQIADAIRRALSGNKNG